MFINFTNLSKFLIKSLIYKYYLLSYSGYKPIGGKNVKG